MDLSAAPLALLAVAAVAAGAVNAVAGGGTLISFPALLAVGVPPVSANVTNTVALSPGYLGGTLAQRDDLAGQRARLVRLVPAAMVGGITGGVLLLVSPEKLFQALVPFLLLAACGLLAVQDPIKRWVARREEQRLRERHHSGIGFGGVAAVFAASIYGGYFGAGVGIVLLAVLGVVVDDHLVRVNALKQTLSLAINGTTACFFLFSGKVVWSAAAVMLVGSLAGGALGGRLVSRLDARVLRLVVIGIGVVVAVYYFVR